MMFDVLSGALGAMTSGPRPLARALEFSAEALENPSEFSSAKLLNYLRAAAPGDETLSLFRRKLALWDNEQASWADNVERNSPERRTLIYEKLSVDSEWIDFCQTRLPFQTLARPTVIATEHRPWYSAAIKGGRDFYWSRYVKQLAKQGWTDDSLLQLDDSTTSIVERLANPANEEAWQSKGLVIGYVQSGKTANFTGVIAKAADAGYKLIIVLGGTLDVLRSQTQRRIDKELIGKELVGREYVNDSDWADFVSHSARPSELGSFDFFRLTGPESDYKSLTAYAAEALKFGRQDSAKPFHHPDNLAKASVRLAVMKKNSSVLQKLLTDLTTLSRGRIGSSLDQVPTLLVDDESDLASINVSKPAADGAEQERTATNKAIVGLLALLPRAQYIGYTATPFANVFVDPASEGDIFPKDFLLSLPRPSGYMGVADFYDLDTSSDEEGPNQRDFVRPVIDGDDKPENLERAIDSFVLSGAIKLWRARRDPALKFRHHTMLVHLSHLQQDHKEFAKQIRKTYSVSGYDGGVGLDRLQKLFDEDFGPVSGRRADGLAVPSSFDELMGDIGNCLQRIGEAADAVLIINNEYKDQTPDFDKQSVWKILTGGAKLSRGYTVEGLTISYYRRRTGAADTLMQMGRWFGFRRGYNDLVRLFIGTEERIGRSPQTINLYEAFGGICRDEEMFRAELQRYASMEEPRITPAQIPPLVPQHMLRPTAPNKMRNAVVEYRNYGGELAESTFAPSISSLIQLNNDLLDRMVQGKAATLRQLRGVTRGAVKLLEGWTIPFTTTDLIAFLKAYKWYDPRTRESKLVNPLRLQIEFLEGRAGDHGITDWLLLGPKIRKPKGHRSLLGADFDVVWRSRDENQPGRFNTYNDPVHRAFAQHICKQILLPEANDELNRLSGKKGVMIYYPITENNEASLDKPAEPPYTVGFTFLFPDNDIRSPIGFSVRRANRPAEAIVDVDD